MQKATVQLGRLSATPQNSENFQNLPKIVGWPPKNDVCAKTVRLSTLLVCLIIFYQKFYHRQQIVLVV